MRIIMTGKIILEAVTVDFNLNISSISSDKKAIPIDKNRVYDVMIIGGGPAALTAAVYCMRKGVSTGLIAGDIGGQLSETSSIENYLGFKYIEGVALVEKFADHVKQFDIGLGEGLKVKSIKYDDVKQIIIENGDIYKARTIIIASGSSWRKLNVPGEKELAGKGVAYCAICDAPLFAGKEVAVVGGGNSGIEAAIDLAKIANRVTIIQFLEKLTADIILQNSLKKFKNIEIFYEHEVKAIKGVDRVSSILIVNRKNGEIMEITTNGVFIEIGLIPNSDMVKGLVDLNEAGEIIVDYACRTSRAGIFAAGDVTSVPFKQVIIAAGEGSKAALSACDYLLKS